MCPLPQLRVATIWLIHEPQPERTLIQMPWLIMADHLAPAETLTLLSNYQPYTYHTKQAAKILNYFTMPCQNIAMYGQYLTSYMAIS